MVIIRIYIPDVDTNKFNEIFTWCEEYFGEFRNNWNYNIITGIWMFRQPEDAVLFRLRWT